MSIQATLGQAIPIKIGGRDAVLNPLSLYEIGLLESSYVAYLRRQSLESTIGLPEHERQNALRAELALVASIDRDITPIFDWVISSHEGLCRALAYSIETHDKSEVTCRQAGQWFMDSGKDETGTPAHQWMVASRLCPDPTEPAETVGSEKNEATDSDLSTEPASDGSTD